MGKPHLPRKPRPWLLAALVIYGLVLALTLLHHEPWRDELQAWLIARDAENLQELWHNTRYEGHPILWHFLLFLAARLWPNPAAMQILHFLVAFTVAALLLFCAPFPFPLRVGLTFSYFFLYEYAVISRNYALTALFIFAFSCLQKGPPLPAAFLAAAASHSSPMGLLAFPALAVWLFTQKRDGRFLALGVALPVAAAAVWSCWPPPDSGYARPLFLAWEPIRAQYVLRGLAGALLPVVPPQLQFWNINWLYPMPRGQQVGEALLTAAAAGTLLAAGWLLWSACGRAKRTFFGWLFGLATCLIFFYAVFPGTVRHHGIFLLLTVAAFWIAPPLSGKKAWRLSLPVGLGLWSALWACSTDWKNAFSANRATALWLSSSPVASLPLVGFPDWAASGVAGWLPGKKLFYPASGDWGTFIRWTKAREQKETALSPLQAKAVAKRKLGGRPFLFLSNQPLTREQVFPCDLVFHSGPVIVPDEAHWLYLCQGRGPEEAVLPFDDDGRSSGGSSFGQGE